MKKIIFFCIFMMTLMSCKNAAIKKEEEKADPDKVQVLYFHTKKRCITCNAIEQLTKEVVDSLANDKIVMRIIDISENEKLADKYEVTWSSLIIDKDGTIKNLTDTGFSYARTNPDQFKVALTEALQNMLD